MMAPPGRATGLLAMSEIARRRWLQTAPLAALLGLLHPGARSGSQREEALADSVRSALSAAIVNQAPPRPLLNNPAERLAFQRWLALAGQQLAARLTEAPLRQEFLQTLWYESKRARLDTALVLGLIQTESNFRKFAVSSAGARGYMQVMPFWARLIGDGDASKLFQVQLNLRFGCVILRHYLDLEQGDVFMALGRYNGSRGQATYPEAVLKARESWRQSG